MSQPVVISASAEGVLGRYTHELNIAPGQNFAIIYGPNGVGKTRFLEILSAMSSLDSNSLAKQPFRRAMVSYSDGSTLAASRDEITHTEQNDTIAFEFVSRGTTHRWRGTAENRFEQWVLANTPWRKLDEGVWESPRTGQLRPEEALRDLLEADYLGWERQHDANTG